MTYLERRERKIQKVKETEWNPTKSELAKVVRAAQKESGCKDVMIESFFYSGISKWNFAHVEFYVYDRNTDERLRDVVLHSYIPDRRRSYVL